MADWISNRVSQEANNAGGAGKVGGDAADEAAIPLLDADPDKRRLGVVLQIPPTATHSVRIAFGRTPASQRHGAFTLPPGGQLDTSELPAEKQPRGEITAWSGPDLDVEGAGRPGSIEIDVTEIVPD